MLQVENRKILMIIPAYNEGKGIRTLINDIQTKASFADVLVVIDLSTDNTKSEALLAGAAVLEMPIRMGIGGAVKAGFKYADTKNYDIALQVDGDGQHDPEYIARLVEPLMRCEADLVIGSRFIEKTGFQSHWSRRIAIKFFSWLTSRIIQKKVTDATSGFRAVNRKMVEFYARHYPVEFPDAEAIILAHYAGFRIAEVSVEMRSRISGKSSINFFTSVYYPFKTLVSITATILRKKDIPS